MDKIEIYEISSGGCIAITENSIRKWIARTYDDRTIKSITPEVACNRFVDDLRKLLRPLGKAIDIIVVVDANEFIGSWFERNIPVLKRLTEFDCNYWSAEQARKLLRKIEKDDEKERIQKGEAEARKWAPYINRLIDEAIKKGKGSVEIFNSHWTDDENILPTPYIDYIIKFWKSRGFVIKSDFSEKADKTTGKYIKIIWLE